MPAIVGPIFIRRVVDDSAAFFGDVFAISPKCTDSPEEERAHFKQGTTD